MTTLADDFSAVFDAHRAELHVHCYRMTGSYADAEELTQETFLRAWRSVGRFEGRSTPRTWLYRIATNACVDFLKSHQRRARPTASLAEILEHEAWIEPYPDRRDPAEIVADAETTNLYLTAVLLQLPPRQRVALIARDVLGFDAAETAEILGCGSVAVNSLLQRARARLSDLAVDVGGLVRPTGNPDIVRAYVDAHNRGDVDAIVELLAADVRISMPPEDPCVGVDDARTFYRYLLGDDRPGDWRIVAVRANGAPAIANYLRRPGDTVHRALSIDVLRISDERITGIHCFLGDGMFPAFGLELIG